MKRQWIIGIGLLAGVALLIGWIARNTYWDEVTVPRFLTGEAARNPFFAVQRLAEELGVSTDWRRSMRELPSTSSVLMVKNWNWDLIEARQEELEAWVEAGGRLLLDQSLSGGEDAFEEWSGLRIEYPSFSQPAADDEESDEESELEETCRKLDLSVGKAQSDAKRTSYDLCGVAPFGWITSSRPPEWALEDSTGAQAVRVNVGRGSVILIHGYPFDTREVLEADNAVLFVDAALLRRGDHIVFVSDDDHASLLELIWIYGAPAVLLFAAFIALALWRNSARFGPLEAHPETSRRSLAEQIRGTGRFVYRIDGGRSLHGAMVRALHDAARLRIPSYDGLHGEDRLAALSRIVGIDADRLGETINFTGRRNHHEFKNTIELLEAARAQVLAHNASAGRGRSPSAAQVDDSQVANAD